MDKIIENARNDVASMKFTIVLAFLFGIALGVLLSPVKNGISIGSYNGCNNNVTNSNEAAKKTEKNCE